VGLAVATANAVTDLAHRHISLGLKTLMGVLVVGWILKFVTDELTSHFSQRIRDFWRGRLHRHFSRPRAEGQRSRGDLALAIERVSEAPSLLLLETSAQVSAIGIGVVFWAVGWLSTLITMALVLLSIPLYQRAGKRSEVLNAQYYERRSLLETRQLELLQHAPELRALGAVAYGAGEIAAISDSEHVLSMRAIRVALESSLVTEFLSGVSIGLVAMVVGFELLDGRLKLLHSLIAVLVTAELFIHIRRYGAEFHRREDAAASMSLLEQVHEIAVTSSISLLDAIDLVGDTPSSPLNLTVSRGERILVTGASGAGKTTLLHTLVGWRSALAGSVGSSGQPIGFVSAESQLLSGSLWSNLTLGADLDPVTVRTMLDNLGLDSPRFYDLYEPLLADGRGLSSGERTRLVLARCLLAKAPLVILDDVAGVLDAPSRDRVRATLGNLTDLAIIEATVDSPLLTTFTHRIEITR
jgi:ABC-type transport system involved in cytochrome bd biosynthesis fused ATPase/permease subunit